MASEVDICNLALSNIRARSINSLNESSLQAQVCKLHYPVLRDQLLRDAPWQFSHKVSALALLNDDLFNWVYAYQYPSDCLYINRLVLNFEEVSSDSSTVRSRFYDPMIPRPNLDKQVEYEIINVDDNRVIASNEPELRADYRSVVIDPNLFDSLFIQTIVNLLSAHIAIPIVGVEGGRGLRNDHFQIYQQLLESANAANLNEQYHPTLDSEFITTRV
jgi:hypothetical protein